MRLSAENLTLERGGRRLFAGLSFAVSAGEALVVVGPNGAGKSSLLRGVAGFLPLRRRSRDAGRRRVGSAASASRRTISAMPTR